MVARGAGRRRPDAGRGRRDLPHASRPSVWPSTSASTPVSPSRRYTGGSSFEVHAEHAAAAIAAGLADVVVSVYAATPRSDRSRRRVDRAGSDRAGPIPQPSGSARTGCACPWDRTRWRRAGTWTQFGTTSEQLAQIAVSTRQWASLNPRARYRDPIIIGDVLAFADAVLALASARLLSRHRRRRCLRHDERRAREDLRQPPVYVLGAATCHDHPMISQMPDLTTTPGAISGPAAFAMAA